MNRRFPFLVYCFCMPIFQVIAATPEPLHWWSFENAVDAEGGSSLRSTPTARLDFAEGVDGSGLFLNNLDGGGQGVVVQDLDLPAGESFTFTVWINPHEVQGGFSNYAPHTIVRFFDDAAPRETTLDFRIRDGKLDVFSAFPSSRNLHSQVDVAVGQWSMVALVCTPDFIRIHSFPVESNPDEETFDWGRDCNFNSAIIGVALPGVSRGLTGFVDEARIYPGALTTAELQEVYEEQKPD